MRPRYLRGLIRLSETEGDLKTSGTTIQVIRGIIDVAVIDEPVDRDEVYLIPIEAHGGAAEFNEGLLDDFLSWVADTPQARIILPGDFLECATRSSIGDVFTQTMSPDVQIVWAQEKLYPIRDRVYGIMAGNHEYRVTKDSNIDPVKIVANQLGIPYFRDGQAILKVRIGSKKNDKPAVYIIHVMHGGSSAQTNGGRLNAAERAATIVENSDVAIYAHTHGLAGSKDRRLIFDPYNNNIREDKRYIVLAGSLLGYAGYAKRRAKKPLPEGCPRIRLDGRKKDVHVTI